MCDTKAILVFLSLVLLSAANFCLYHAHTENKVKQNRGIKSQDRCENKDKKYCLNNGQRYYVDDENTVRCNCILLYRGKGSEKYMWWG